MLSLYKYSLEVTLEKETADVSDSQVLLNSAESTMTVVKREARYFFVKFQFVKNNILL